MDPANILLTCPYNESHRIRQSRMARHLKLCRANYPDAKHMKICPFNSTHIIPDVEYDYHVEMCEDAVNVIHYTHRSEEDEKKEQDSLSVIQNLTPPCTESWDQDENVIDYDPMEHVKDKPILMNLSCVSKSVKKQFRVEQHKRFENCTQKNENVATSSFVTSQENKFDHNTYDNGLGGVSNSVQNDVTVSSKGKKKRKNKKKGANTVEMKRI